MELKSAPADITRMVGKRLNRTFMELKWAKQPQAMLKRLSQSYLYGIEIRCPLHRNAPRLRLNRTFMELKSRPTR